MRRATVLFVLLASLMPSRADAGGHRDPFYDAGLQWGLSMIHGEAAWNGSTGKGSIVAVVDTGVDFHHPDLRGRLLKGIDLADADGDATDDNGHGTLMAGIIAADSSNGVGVASVAPDAKILPVRVLGKDGTGSSSNVARGIRWAREHGANVINLSLAEESGQGSLNVPDSVLRGPAVDDAIKEAAAAGVTVLIAAGNDRTGGKPQTAYDATVDGVLVVGASTKNDRRAAYSNYGSGLDLLAPGGGSATDPSDGACKAGSTASTTNSIVSTWWDPGDSFSYGGGCGTSMAVGFVSGVAALLHSQGLSNTEITKRILRTADDIGAPGRDAQTGAGRLNAARALGVSIKVPAVATPKSIAQGGNVPVATPSRSHGSIKEQLVFATPVSTPGGPSRPIVPAAAALSLVVCLHIGRLIVREMSARERRAAPLSPS